MMVFEFRRDKSAVSNMVGYVLLISITIGLSVLVYSWLRFYVEEEDVAECPEGIEIVISDYECYPSDEFGEGRLVLTLKNKGRFSIDGYSLRVHDREGADFGFYTFDENGSAIFPGKEFEKIYYFKNYTFDGYNLSTITFVEVQPFVLKDGEISCKSYASKEIKCPSAQGSTQDNDSGGGSGGGGSEGGGSGGGGSGGGGSGGGDCSGVADGISCDGGVCLNEICVSPTTINSCGELNESNSYYVLGQDIIQPLDENCLSISANDVLLDCMEYSITTTSGASTLAGIYSNASNTIIGNCNVSMGDNFGRGIWLDGANNSYIFGNVLEEQYYGLLMEYVYNSTIENNIMNNNNFMNDGYGVKIRESSNNFIIDNNISFNVYGVEGDGFSDYNVFDNNFINNNSNGSGDVGIGIAIAGKYNDVVYNNLANNGYIGVRDSGRYNNFSNNNIVNSRYGVFGFNTAMYSNFNYNIVRNSQYGIYFERATNNIFLANNLNNNYHGFYFVPWMNLNSRNNTFIENIANYNTDLGFYFLNVSDSVLIDNNATGNLQGIVFNDGLNNNLTNNVACFNGVVDVFCSVDQIFSGNQCGSGDVCGGTCLAC